MISPFPLLWKAMIHNEFKGCTICKNPRPTKSDHHSLPSAERNIRCGSGSEDSIDSRKFDEIAPSFRRTCPDDGGSKPKRFLILRRRVPRDTSLRGYEDSQRDSHMGSCTHGQLGLIMKVRYDDIRGQIFLTIPTGLLSVAGTTHGGRATAS